MQFSGIKYIPNVVEESTINTQNFFPNKNSIPLNKNSPFPQIRLIFITMKDTHMMQEMIKSQSS